VEKRKKHKKGILGRIDNLQAEINTLKERDANQKLKKEIAALCNVVTSIKQLSSLSEELMNCIVRYNPQVSTVGTVTVGDIEVPFHVKVGKSSKYVHLRFTQDLQLEVVIPPNARVDAKSVLKKKQAWIERKYDELSSRRCVFNAGSVMHKGRYLEISAVSPSKEGDEIEIKNDKIIVYVNGMKEPLSLLKEWMRKATLELLTSNLPVYATRFSISLGNVSVKNTKRWGYCTKDGDLIFTWQLVALPDRLAKYVMIHELTHLLEFNHSKRFWAKVASMCPDYKEQQHALSNICTTKSADLNAYELLNLDSSVDW
jgi:predicted metal-dependent hydrolase